MPAAPAQSPQEPRKSKGGPVASSEAAKRLEAILEARNSAVRASAISGTTTTTTSGCAPGCFVCAGGGSLSRSWGKVPT